MILPRRASVRCQLGAVDQSDNARAGIHPHPNLREHEFQVFEQDQPRGCGARPPRFRSQLLGEHRKRDQRHAREADGRFPPWRAACGSPRSRRSASGCCASPPTCGSRSHCRACSSERSKSTQQRRIDSNSGCRREISLALVERLAPLIRSRCPRLAARSSMASTTREAPPGERDDAVGVAVELDLFGRHHRNEPDEAERQQQERAERTARPSRGRGGEAADRTHDRTLAARKRHPRSPVLGPIVGMLSTRCDHKA